MVINKTDAVINIKTDVVIDHCDAFIDTGTQILSIIDICLQSNLQVTIEYQ